MCLRVEAANAAVGIVNGRIVGPCGHFDRVIAVPDGQLHPGLINAHDHLRLNHFGQLGHGPYANAYDWAADIQRRFREAIAKGRALPRRKALLVGAWKNLLAGVTTVVHHDMWEPDFERDFPINVPHIAFADSLGMTPALAPPSSGIFALHLAEGVDAEAAEEVRTLDARGLLNSRLIAVHAVGPDPDGIARLHASGCAIVWCPTSNHFLFDRTSPAPLLADGMDVLLGTDSLLTGAGNLLDELRAARGGVLSDERLLDAVGALAARRLGLAEPSLKHGARADLIVLRRPLLDAQARDIALVMVQGRIRVLDPSLLEAAPVSDGQILQSDGVERWVSERDSLQASALQI